MSSKKRVFPAKTKQKEELSHKATAPFCSDKH